MLQAFHNLSNDIWQRSAVFLSLQPFMKPEGIHEIDIQEVISPKQEVEDSNEQNVETCLPRMQLSEKEPCLWRVWIFYVKKGQLKMHIESVNKGIRIMSVDSAIMLPQKSGS